jgi:hypothetical protein
MKKRNRHIGSTLDDFLRKDGAYKELRESVAKEMVGPRVPDVARRRHRRKRKAKVELV